MKKQLGYIVGLLLVSCASFSAPDNGDAFTANEAIRMSKLGKSSTYARQSAELLSLAFAAIRSSTDEGDYYAAVRVDDYRQDSIDAVVKKLTQEGYRVKVTSPYETYVQDKIISIEWGEGLDAAK